MVYFTVVDGLSSLLSVYLSLQSLPDSRSHVPSYEVTTHLLTNKSTIRLAPYPFPVCFRHDRDIARGIDSSLAERRITW
jgi:hypothetical protein